MTIKWIRLQEIVEEITDSEIIIHATTQITDGRLRGVTGINIDRSQILLNMQRAKSLEDVIDILAHETAHIVMEDDIHNDRHKELWDKIRGKIRREYDER